MNPTPGEVLRDSGCQLATNNAKSQSVALRLAILDMVLQGRAVSIDDVMMPRDGIRRGNFVGAAFLSLKKRGLIRQTGEFVTSKRKFRHGGRNPVWTSSDLVRCRAEAARLRTELEKMEPPPARQGTLFPSPAGGST